MFERVPSGIREEIPAGILEGMLAKIPEKIFQSFFLSNPDKNPWCYSRRNFLENTDGVIREIMARIPAGSWARILERNIEEIPEGIIGEIAKKSGSVQKFWHEHLKKQDCLKKGRQKSIIFHISFGRNLSRNHSRNAEKNTLNYPLMFFLIQSL